MSRLFGWAVFAVWLAWRWRSIVLPMLLVAAALSLAGCAGPLPPPGSSPPKWEGWRFDRHWRARPID